MKVNKPFKIIGIVLMSLLGLGLIGNFGINYLIKIKLPKIIEEKNDSAYDFVYEDLSFSIFDNSLSVENIKVTPKKNANIRKDIDFYGKVGKISVTGVNFIELIKHKNLKAFTIYVDDADITVLKPAQRDTLKTESTLASSVDIDKIAVRRANLKIMTSGGDTLLNQLHNMNVEVDGVHMGKYTQKKDIPFTYENYHFKIDSVYSKMNDFQYIKSGAIAIDKENFDMNNFRIYPAITSSQFKNTETESNTRLNLQVPLVNLKKTDWGYDQNNDFYLSIGQINIDSINFNILDQKKQTVFQQAKKDAEKVIQPLIPFRVDVEEINIKRSSFNSLNVLDVNNVNINIKKISNRVEERLYIEEFNLINPQLIHFPNKAKKDHNSSQKSQLNDLIVINKLNVKDAHYILKDKTGTKNTLTVNDFNLSLFDIKIDDETVKQKIPFIYQNPYLSTGKVHFDSGKNYNIYTNGITIKDHNAFIKNIQMKPKVSRRAHANALKYGEDLYNITSGKIELNGLSYGFDNTETFFLKFKNVILNQVDANIYRDASIPNNPKENTLYSKKLRQLDIGLEIGVLKIVNSKIVYEEDSQTSTAPGKISFANFNLTAKNIYSGHNKTSGPKTIIDVHTVFMNKSNLKANWSFNILNKYDVFNINGEIQHFPAEGMNPFLKPYLNATAKGTIEKMQFNFTGNNDSATGLYGMQFDDLKMTLYKKDGVSERKFLNKLGNWFIRNDTKGDVMAVEIKPVNRRKDSSFFNYLWLCVMQGLKQTVL